MHATGTIAESTTRNGAWTIRLSRIVDNTGTLYVVRTFATGTTGGPRANAAYRTEDAARDAANGAWRRGDGTIPAAR